jgi:hypothetical protein
MRRHSRKDRGIALLVTIFTLTLVSALAAAVVLTTTTESMIAGSFRRSLQAKYAAGAAAEWAVAELASAADWSPIVAGSAPSTFVDGPADGVRRLAGGATIDLAAIALSNPGWRLYAYGPFNDLVPASDAIAQFYIVALVSPGASADRLNVRGMASGPFGARHVVELTVVRASGGVRVERWAFS